MGVFVDVDVDAMAKLVRANRNHQGLDNRLIEPEPGREKTSTTDPVQRRERLGGMLNYYYRAAA
jgi:hypothetical protein